MTTRGTRIAFWISVACVLALPRVVPCRYPGEVCLPVQRGKRTCERSETEPLGIYWLEWLLSRDVGIRYGVDEVCR